ncbi:BadF/BadG/BcrA/BcrD ATPase family protein [Anaerocolumna xylanovorans]|uniref:BadF-type ATPase n=1 Tax=Anaerocolumna xylanovorans DSM 12503 TaxID=1121345 RepID=A0A1M7XY89_9FIRM|nr:BadF/BadG/BcrA/BcrD ATPase family protein [Anaerocolumna xylanovorans]SHO43994.1 BadF-type ATPase [Anaerocolumna xylanovorans DSM 12503]
MERYVIGMDGGGTKTAVLLADTNGKILEEFTGGTMNYNGSSKEFIDSNLQSIFHIITEKGFQAQGCAAICVGAAGISNLTVKEQLLDNIRKAGYLCPVSLVGDVDTAFAGALENQEGIILISGTGSICLGKDKEGNSCRTGGYGHLIDDVGSGYAIAREILSAVVKSSDGRRRPTLLKQLVFEYLNISRIEELISYVYAPNRNKKEIAELSVLIEKAAECEDAAAERIIEGCVSDLVELAAPVVGQWKEAPVLAVSGSVLLHNALIYDKFCVSMQKAYPGITVTKAKKTAVYGAVLLALKLWENNRTA